MTTTDAVPIGIAWSPSGTDCATCGQRLDGSTPGLASDLPGFAFATTDEHTVCDTCASRIRPDAYLALTLLRDIDRRTLDVHSGLVQFGACDTDTAVSAYLSTIARGVLYMLRSQFVASEIFQCDTCKGWFEYAESGGHIPTRDGARYCDRCHPDNRSTK